MPDGSDQPRQPRKDTRRLTKKQEAFALAYVETGIASDAYRRSYDCQNSTDEVIWTQSCLLLKNQKVAKRIDELQAESRERNNITIDSLTKMLMDDRTLARDKEQASAAIQAVMGLAKMHGLIVDKDKTENDNRSITNINITWIGDNGAD